MTIYLDPDAQGVTAAHLKAFERGKYGPIFASKQGQQSTATQQAPSYTHLPTTTSMNYSIPSAVPRGFSYPIPTSPSGYASSTGYQVPSGYPAPSGHPIPSGYTTRPNIYDENDENDEKDDEPEEKKD